jgi:hypothetical protein
MGVADNESVVGFYHMAFCFCWVLPMCDRASPHYNLTYYTTYVPCGRGSFITLMFFLIIIRHVCFFFFFVDLIDTTASVRDPSCLLCFHFYVCFFVLFSQLGAGQKCASLSRLCLFFFFDIIYSSILGFLCC